MNRADLETAAYEAEARAARTRIVETVNEIQHRLNPKTIANQAMDAAIERGSQAARQAREAAAEHIVGVAVVGIGLGLLFGAASYAKQRKTPKMNQYEDEYDDTNEKADRLAGIKQGASHLRETVAERSHAAKEAAAQRLAAARDYTAETWDAARERAHEYGEKAKENARIARDRTAEGVDHNPLTAALIGAAVGAIVGALLPSTRREDRAFGSTRDKLADQAKSAALAARDAGKARFEELGIKEQAKAEFDRLKETASDIAAKARDAAKDATGASKH